MGRALEMAQRSLERIEAKDRDGWLALFADEAVVEDPVGPSMFDPEGLGRRGKQAIENFYDNVIAMSEKVGMTFSLTIECGDEVARSGEIRITLVDGKVGRVPCVSIYKVDEEGKLISLRVFWDQDALEFT